MSAMRGGGVLPAVLTPGTRTFAVASLLLVAGALALPGAVPAKLPKKPACTDVSAALLKRTFGFSFSKHGRSRRHDTRSVRHLACVYRSSAGELSITYDRYPSVAAARAHYVSFRKALIRRGNAEPPDAMTQLLPLVKLPDIGDAAFRSTDGTVVEFVDGVATVTLEHGFAQLTPRVTRAMVSLAEHVDRRG